MTENNVIALLPMKGNSERVPGKNIKPFNGQPLFTHILEKLSRSKYISEIIINTDSETISELAITFDKVTIHQRPENLCGDFISMNKIIEYDIKKSNGLHFLQTHSTNPLLKTSSIDQGIEMYFHSISTGFDSVFSVTRLQTRLYDISGKPLNHNPEELIRTQDLPPLFEENSNFFIFSSNSFKEANGRRIGNSPKMVEINKIEALDIDEPEDFLIAETIQKLNL